jgi:hypothetical protein
MSDHEKPSNSTPADDEKFGGPVQNPSKLPEWDPKSVEEDGPGSEKADDVTEPVTGIDPDIAPDPEK